MAEIKTAEAPKKKAKKELSHITIKEGEKGGHVVTHHFTSSGPEYFSGGEEEHIFGKEDGEKLLDHLTKKMHIKGAPKGEELEDEHEPVDKANKKHAEREESHDEDEQDEDEAKPKGEKGDK